MAMKLNKLEKTKRFARLGVTLDKSVYLREFDNYNQFAAAVEYGEPHDDDPVRVSRDTDRATFHTEPDFPTMMRKLRRGWPEALRRVDEMVMRTAEGIAFSETMGMEIVPNYIGQRLDWDRYNSGHPLMMIDQQERFVPDRVVKILFQVAAFCDVSIEQLWLRGAMVMGLVQALERVGISTQVDAIQSIDDHGDVEYHLFVPLKSAGHRMSPDRLAFAICNGDMLRRAVFAVEECESEALVKRFGFKQGGGYGRPTEAPREVCDHYDIYTSHAHRLRNADEVRREIRKHLEAQGVVLA